MQFAEANRSTSVPNFLAILERLSPRWIMYSIHPAGCWQASSVREVGVSDGVDEETSPAGRNRLYPATRLAPKDPGRQFA